MKDPILDLHIVFGKILLETSKLKKSNNNYLMVEYIDHAIIVKYITHLLYFSISLMEIVDMSHLHQLNVIPINVLLIFYQVDNYASKRFLVY